MRGLLFDSRVHLAAALAGVLVVGMAPEAEPGDPDGHGDPSCCDWCAQLASVSPEPGLDLPPELEMPPVEPWAWGAEDASLLAR